MRSIARDGPYEWVFFALAALLAILGSPREHADRHTGMSGTRPDGALRVLTWNVGGSGGVSGQPLQDAWLPAIRAVLQDLDPDVAVFQELDRRAQLDALLAGSTGRWHVACTDRGDRRVGALARAGQLKSSVVPAPGGRAFLQLELRPAEGPALRLLGVHCDAYSAHLRNRQIGLAVQVLQRHPGARLLAGDLNLDLDLGKRSDLFSDDEQLDVESYNFAVQSLADLGIAAGSTAEPDRRLDYMLADAGTVSALQVAVCRGRRTGSMDHDPLVADLRLRAEETRR